MARHSAVSTALLLDYKTVFFPPNQSPKILTSHRLIHVYILGLFLTKISVYSRLRQNTKLAIMFVFGAKSSVLSQIIIINYPILIANFWRSIYLCKQVRTSIAIRTILYCIICIFWNRLAIYWKLRVLHARGSRTSCDAHVLFNAIATIAKGLKVFGERFLRSTLYGDCTFFYLFYFFFFTFF